jgi:pilus assembly protein CpaC
MNIVMVVGQTRVFPANGVRRVAVGQGEVLEAVVIEGNEVLVFARGSGRSTLHIWRAGDVRDDYDITVEKASIRQVQSELQALLRDLPDVCSRVAGGKIVIEGGALSDADRARIAALAQRYPDVVDFTSDLGWEQMIMLDVQVVEIPRSRLLEFGLNWDGGPQGGIHAGMAWDTWDGRAVTERPGEPPIARPGTNASLAGILGVNALWSARIRALAESGEAVVLAQPQFLARIGATAEFLAGGEVPYKHVDSNNRATTQFKPYGVSLKMTPRAERNGIVRAHIAVDDQLVGDNGPALKTRRASIEFNVVSGRTLVLAGFLSHDRAESHTGIPLLRDIPVLGAVFGAKRRSQRDIELVIFVTPTIVDEHDPALAERVYRAQALTDAFRQTPPVLNVPLIPQHTPFGGNVSKPEMLFSGPGSQWQSPDFKPSL